jgi:hypothetical protein
MKSLAVTMGVDEAANSDKVVEAYDLIKGRPKLPTRVNKPIRVPAAGKHPPGDTAIKDLPLIPYAGNQRHAGHVIDVIEKWEGEIGDIGYAALDAGMSISDYANLPPPFRPRMPTDLAYTMHVSVVERGPGHTEIVKYFQFEKMNNVYPKLEEVKKLMYGIYTFNMSWSNDRKTCVPVLIQMMQQLGGIMWKYSAWPEELPAKEAGEGRAYLTGDEIKEAWAYVREECPAGNFDGEQLEWLTHILNEPENPAFDLCKKHFGLVREYMNKKSAKQNLATKETYYPLTWEDLTGQARRIMRVVLPLLLTTSVLFVGKAGVAKTPLGMIVCFMMARFHGATMEDVVAAVRIASEIDFFRGEEGCKWIPCFFDDGDLWEQRIRALKAFFDPSKYEGMVYARWGAAKFPRGQCRIAADNTYDEAVEPDDVQWLQATCVSKEEKEEKTTGLLLDMVKKSFPAGIDRENILALLKRVTIVLNTKKFVYVRLAGVCSVVTRESFEGHYITEAAGKTLYKYLKHQEKVDVEIMQRKIEDETDFMKELMLQAKMAEQVAESCETRVAGAVAVKRELQGLGPTGPRRKWANHVIKLEPEPVQSSSSSSSSSWNRNLEQSPNGPIDLCSPVRQRRTTLDDLDGDVALEFD